MGLFSSRPHNSHLTTPTWALAVSGLCLLNIGVLMALFSIGPLACDSSSTSSGGDPRLGQPQRVDTSLSCDPGVTRQEQERVVRLGVLGIGMVLAGFLLGTFEMVTRMVRNLRADDDTDKGRWGSSARRD